LWRPPPLNPYSTGMDDTDSEGEGEGANKASKKNGDGDDATDESDKPKGEMCEE